MAQRRGPPPSESTPICRCRVLYLGSSVPHVTKDGLQGIQEPLRELYPSEGISNAKGIDSWLSVWSNGLLLENVDEKQKKVTRFFPIESLHYCAAVRYVLVPGGAQVAEKERSPRFLPLDSPFARSPNIAHPPLFAAILRRTTGIKVLECHVFICKRETPANALVRCCFHAYADSMYARQLDGGLYSSIYGTLPARQKSPRAQSVAEAQIDVIEKVEEWQAEQGNSPVQQQRELVSESGVSGHENGHNADEVSVYNGDQNHKVWAGAGQGEAIYNEYENAGRASVYGTTGSRHLRPRQRLVAAGPPPPPPPLPPDTETKKKVKKHKTRSERSSPASPARPNGHGINANGINGHSMNGHGMNGHGMNGHGMNGHPPRSSSAMDLSPPGHGRPPRVNGHAPPPMNGYSSLGRPVSRVNGRMVASPRHRVARGGSVRPLPPPMHLYPPQVVYGTLPPPPHVQMVPLPPMIPGYGAQTMTLPHPGRPGSRAAEEPTYLPSARPLSPTASYQPGHFPHDAYLMQQQYASVDRRRRVRRKPQRADGEASPPSVGIYKQRKNHLNEKAFSYSIQQEHRSRSFGSLLENGDPRPVSREEVRKNRELQQMMHELELSGDELERSEVRPGMYKGPDSVSQLSHHSHHSAGFRRL